VEVGIITAPAIAAQGIASLMTRGGVRAIWNFAPVKINAPANVIILNEDLYSSLGVLLQKLNSATRG
jgi:redox-sensing transcriptional repressor